MSTTIFPPNNPNSPAANGSSVPQHDGADSAKAPQPAPDPTPTPPKPTDGGAASKPSASHEKIAYRLLSHTEWAQYCRGVGVFKDDESEQIIRPTSQWWPPNGFRDGLYRDVLIEKTKFGYWFRAIGTVTWTLMLIQIAISAVLTALGSLPSKDGTAITSIAAVNTCVGGILALLHNSGLPDRYRKDKNEFYKIEEHLKAIVDTAVVPADQDLNEVLAGCFDMFRQARQTVQNNHPASYTASPGKTPAPKVSQIIEPKK
ncbi:hypothetical protein F4820DRAFT_30052 [Hypoxylon rubiginosum]|uniref:Uncharacterized protein n=1 Tax=Hypoxylon rubiginosum TaxID=110542 RepID=A0ACB9ZC98_9PEZI|nr:hypothetical protein F4820DRAFT_30052 [Hypoxylon rubiginosum]